LYGTGKYFAQGFNCYRASLLGSVKFGTFLIFDANGTAFEVKKISGARPRQPSLPS
jgi:hypothetical protein